MIWVLGPAGVLGLVGLTYALLRSRTGPSPDEKDAVPLRLGEVRAWVRRTYAQHLQLDASLRARAAAALEAEQRAIARAQEALEQATGGRPPVPMFLLFAVLTAVGLWGFMATYAVDRGLLETIHSGEQQASVFALFVAVITFVIGTVLVEAIAPHGLRASHPAVAQGEGELDAIGLAAVQARRSSLWRLPVALLLGLGFLVIVAVMVEVAPARAQRANGSLVEAAEAACLEIESDPLASAGDRSIVCAEAQDKRADLERGILFDRLLAAGAPAADLIGAFGAIRFAEMLFVLGFAWQARRARSGRLASAAAIGRALPDFTARIYRLVTRADVPRGIAAEVERELTALGITFGPALVPPEPTARPPADPSAGPRNDVTPQTGPMDQPTAHPQGGDAADQPADPDEDPPIGPDEFDRF